MSFKFGKNSEKQLATVKPELQKVARRALEISPHDFTIVQGIRTAAQSAQNIANGTSFLSNPNKSKHITGDALDFAPFINGKIDWNDYEVFWAVKKAFQQAGQELGVKLRFGADWNNSNDYRDEIQRGTYDGGHVELV
ncbi:endolysin [Yersinia phage phiR2-01]|uniref:Lysozyme n=1 Tax=Yersinia phage phiR2-01 TaxID=1206557 RepID=I7K2L2_9CAUD|nr:endolysin [Yersinia phage phiR2-01]CCI88461.1 lysozyme [Yersinia phage phiR2-01]